jgi:hypothetical protein
MDTRGKGAVESMRYLRMLGIGLVAMFALGAIGVSSASAFKPELGKCGPIEIVNEETGEHEFPGIGGKYSDQSCLVKAAVKGHGESKVYQGAYEWKPLSEKTGVIVNPATTTVTLETTSGNRIECSDVREENTSVTFLGNAGRTPLWIFEGCQSEEKPCTTGSIGSLPGAISNGLAWLEEEGRNWTGRFGYLTGKGTPEPLVGLEYTSNNLETGEAEPFFTPISCEGSIGTVLLGGDKEHGSHKEGDNSFIGTFGPVNTMTHDYTITYEESAPGVPTVEHFETGSNHSLRAFIHNGWERVAIEATMTFEFGNRVEMRATHPQR